MIQDIVEVRHTGRMEMQDKNYSQNLVWCREWLRKKRAMQAHRHKQKAMVKRLPSKAGLC